MHQSYILSYSFIGQPVGWCISDRENTEVMQHFLQSLKDRSPSTVVSVLMIDDDKFYGPHHKILIIIIPLCITTDNTGWNVASSVYCSELRHLFCHWHVDRYVLKVVVMGLFIKGHGKTTCLELRMKTKPKSIRLLVCSFKKHHWRYSLIF